MKNIGSRIGELFVIWRNNFDKIQNRFDELQYLSFVRDFLDAFFESAFDYEFEKMILSKLKQNIIQLSEFEVDCVNCLEYMFENGYFRNDRDELEKVLKTADKNWAFVRDAKLIIKLTIKSTKKIML